MARTKVKIGDCKAYKVCSDHVKCPRVFLNVSTLGIEPGGEVIVSYTEGKITVTKREVPVVK